MKKLMLFITMSFTMFSAWAHGEGTGPTQIGLVKRPLVWTFPKDSVGYLKLGVTNQIWFRYAGVNPGTVDVNGDPMKTSFDIGVRRARITLFGRLSKRFYLYTQLGINNQTFINGGNYAGTQNDNINSGNKKPGLFFHDITSEYVIVQKKLNIGAGLNSWGGISRLTNVGIPTMLMLDLPLFNFPTIEQQDQFARQFGVYAKGQVGKFDYRFTLAKPFVYGVKVPNSATPAGQAVDHSNQNIALKGYVNYNFFDMEDNEIPFMVFNYLGKKKVLTVGAGFYSQKDFSVSADVNGNTSTHDALMTGVDVFMDLPSADKKSAITSYLVWYHYNMGPNYLRSVGVMNPFIGSGTGVLTQGVGIRQFTIGTGEIIHWELGYLLPFEVAKSKVQPYGALTYKSFNALSDNTLQPDLGLNYLIEGHFAKISLQYSSRPIFDRTDNNSNDLHVVSHRGMLTMQFQVAL